MQFTDKQLLLFQLYVVFTASSFLLGLVLLCDSGVKFIKGEPRNGSVFLFWGSMFVVLSIAAFHMASIYKDVITW